jgi:hypothetical protein
MSNLSLPFQRPERGTAHPASDTLDSTFRWIGVDRRAWDSDVRKLGYQTHIVRSGDRGDYALRHFKTDIVRVLRGPGFDLVTLDARGHRSVTTSLRYNMFFRAAGIPVSVHRENWAYILTINGVRYEFIDGVQFSAWAEDDHGGRDTAQAGRPTVTVVGKPSVSGVALTPIR